MTVKNSAFVNILIHKFLCIYGHISVDHPMCLVLPVSQSCDNSLHSHQCRVLIRVFITVFLFFLSFLCGCIVAFSCVNLYYPVE